MILTKNKLTTEISYSIFFFGRNIINFLRITQLISCSCNVINMLILKTITFELKFQPSSGPSPTRELFEIMRQ